MNSKQVKQLRKKVKQFQLEWMQSLLSEDEAKKITLEIHNTGSGVAGKYSHEVAEHLATEAVTAARKNGSPLKVTVEAE